jgi:AraC family transcriptional regulator, regulatory protein of adaptative response / DNA-3-methyladenine glycosylase II
MSRFAAIATTGIYCLPTCSARPKPENVRPYSLQAAAEADGYRACLRCRPYRQQEGVGWTGLEVVCRAVRLITDGALDGSTEEDLAARLFISARHLRRLFLDHVGATPQQLARSNRAHFARRLLDDTDLTISEIALATGYGSVRQLNRAMLEVFRAPPSELRARRRVGDRLVADGGLLLRVPFEPPLEWSPMLEYLAERAVPGVESVTDGTYRRTIEVDGDPGVLEFSPGGRDHLLLRAHLPHWGGLIHIVQRARRIFGLDADVVAANHALALDPIIGPFVRAAPGLRPPGTWDPFEAGVCLILGQRTSASSARAFAARMVEAHGRRVGGLQPMGLGYLFPTPSALARADLSPIGVPEPQGAAVRAFARAVADEVVSLDGASGLQELLTSLTAIPGLSRSTAQALALRMGERDAFPASEPGLRRSLAKATGNGAGAREIDAIAERWRPWRAHAAFYLMTSRRVASTQGQVHTSEPQRRVAATIR